MEFKSHFGIMACAIFAAISVNSPAAQWEYRVVTIGDKGGFEWTADKINNAGQVIGTYRSRTEPGLRGYLYSRGKVVDLGTVWPMDLNDHGDVIMWWVGDDTHPSGTTLLYSGGRFTNVTELATRSNEVVAVHGRAINNAGTIVGGARFGTHGDDYPFIYSNGVMRLLSRVPGYEHTEATDINNLGQMIGHASDGTAAIYEGTNRIVIGGIPNRLAASVSSINDLGQIAGAIDSLDEGWQPCIWINRVPNVVETLPGLPSGGLSDINNLGVAVGSCRNIYVPGSSRGIIHKDGVTQDINSLTRKSRFQIIGASSINDHGWIAATAVIEGTNPRDEPYAILLRPKGGKDPTRRKPRLTFSLPAK